MWLTFLSLPQQAMCKCVLSPIHPNSSTYLWISAGLAGPSLLNTNRLRASHTHAQTHTQKPDSDSNPSPEKGLQSKGQKSSEANTPQRLHLAGMLATVWNVAGKRKSHRVFERKDASRISALLNFTDTVEGIRRFLSCVSQQHLDIKRLRCVSLMVGSLRQTVGWRPDICSYIGHALFTHSADSSFGNNSKVSHCLDPPWFSCYYALHGRLKNALWFT